VTNPEGALVASIFQHSEPVVIVDPAGASTINVIASPAHGMLMLCQDADGDYDVIVMSRQQASAIAGALLKWVTS